MGQRGLVRTERIRLKKEIKRREQVGGKVWWVYGVLSKTEQYNYLKELVTAIFDGVEGGARLCSYVMLTV